MWSVGAKLKAPTARIPIVLRPPSKPLLVANSTPHLREQWFISGIRHDACVSPVPHTHQSPFIHYFPTDMYLHVMAGAGTLKCLKYVPDFSTIAQLVTGGLLIYILLSLPFQLIPSYGRTVKPKIYKPARHFAHGGTPHRTLSTVVRFRGIVEGAFNLHHPHHSYPPGRRMTGRLTRSAASALAT